MDLLKHITNETVAKTAGFDGRGYCVPVSLARHAVPEPHKDKRVAQAMRDIVYPLLPTWAKCRREGYGVNGGTWRGPLVPALEAMGIEYKGLYTPPKRATVELWFEEYHNAVEEAFIRTGGHHGHLGYYKYDSWLDAGVGYDLRAGMVVNEYYVLKWRN